MNPRSGDLLRGWYEHVHAVTLTAGLGERVTMPAAAEIYATATAGRQVLGSRCPNSALRLAGTVTRPTRHPHH